MSKNKHNAAPKSDNPEHSTLHQQRRHRSIGELALNFFGIKTREQRIREQEAELNSAVRKLYTSHQEFTDRVRNQGRAYAELQASPDATNEMWKRLHVSNMALSASVEGLSVRSQLYEISGAVTSLTDRWGVGRVMGIRPSAIDKAVHGIVGNLMTDERKPKPLTPQTLIDFSKVYAGLDLNSEEQKLTARTVYGFLYDSTRATLQTSERGNPRMAHDKSMDLVHSALLQLGAGPQEARIVHDRIDDGVGYDLYNMYTGKAA